MEDGEFLAHKLNIHLDLWAAEKSELEHLLYMVERSDRHNPALQQYRKALLDVALGLQQQELQLAKFKLETALDDIAIWETQTLIINSQLLREKEQIEELNKQAYARESRFLSQQAVFADKLRAASQTLVLETRLQELQQQVHRVKQEHETELAKERANKKHCKANAAKTLGALLREIGFISNQVKCMKEECCNRIKAKDEKYRGLVRQTKELNATVEEAERIAQERLTEMRGLELQQSLQKLDEVRRENENLRMLYAELEAKVNDAQEVSKRGRVSRKDSTTRNLTAELNAAAKKVDENCGTFRRKKTGEKVGGAKRKRKRSETIENSVHSEQNVAETEEGDSVSQKGGAINKSGRARSENHGKRRQGEEVSMSSERKALTARSTNVSEGVKTNFFSSSFNVPKVKAR